MAYKRISGFSDEISKVVDVQFEVLNKLNIKYFEPRGVDGFNISDMTEENVILLGEKMKKNGIQVSSIGSPIGKIKLDADYETHFEKFKRVVHYAKLLDSKYIRIFSFFGNGEADWTEEERTVILERLKQMIEYAKSQDVILLHENEKGIYGDTADRCADLMKELSCSHFRAVFDPANFVQVGENTLYAYEKLKEYIEYVHIKDAFAQNGRVVPAGMGDGNVEFILKNLFENGYQGFLSLEPHLGSLKELADLGLEDKIAQLPESGEGTFTLAYQMLCEVLDKINKNKNYCFD